jgi:hypothetical protein
MAVLVFQSFRVGGHFSPRSVGPSGTRSDDSHQISDQAVGLLATQLTINEVAAALTSMACAVMWS